MADKRQHAVSEKYFVSHYQFKLLRPFDISQYISYFY